MKEIMMLLDLDQEQQSCLEGLIQDMELVVVNDPLFD